MGPATLNYQIIEETAICHKHFILDNLSGTIDFDDNEHSKSIIMKLPSEVGYIGDEVLTCRLVLTGVSSREGTVMALEEKYSTCLISLIPPPRPPTPEPEVVITMYEISDSYSEIKSITTSASRTTTLAGSNEYINNAFSSSSETLAGDKSKDSRMNLTAPAQKLRSLIRTKVLPGVRMKLAAQFNTKWERLESKTRKNASVKKQMQIAYNDFHNVVGVPEEMAECIEPVAFFQFSSGTYRVGSDKEEIYIDVRRGGGVRHAVRVGWSTRDDTAVHGENYVRKDGFIDFLPGERVKRIHIELLNRHVSKSLHFMVEFKTMEGLIWELPDGAVDYDTNYEAEIEMISVMAFNKFTQKRIAKPDELKVVHSTEDNQHTASWLAIEGGENNVDNSIAEYEIQYKQASLAANVSDEMNRIRISGLDSQIYLPGDHFKPVTDYNLRVMAIDFANNLEQTEYVNFESAKAPPNPPSKFFYDKQNEEFRFSDVDEKAETTEFEIAYCYAEDATEVHYIDLGPNDRSAKCKLEKGKNYISCIRAFNSSGVGGSKIFQIYGDE